MNSIKFLLLLLPAFIIFLSTGTYSQSAFPDEPERTSPLKDKNTKSAVYELQDTFHKIYELYKDTVVFISTERTVKVRYANPFMDDPFFRQFFGQPGKQKETERKQQGLGSGFIVSSDGYICTNNHVIANMDSVNVIINNKKYKARVVGSDELTDIALLKIEDKGRFKPAYFADSEKVKIGDMAVAIGNPFGLDKTYTFGIISAIGRKDLDPLGNSHIQTDASINQGNSGGPLINMNGEVIGVNRMIFSQTGGNLGIGFAISINTVRETLAQLKAYGKVKRGYLGVGVDSVTPEIAKQLGLSKPEGAIVAKIEKGTPADIAGIQEKDVIIAVDGKDIRDYRDLIASVNKKIGDTVEVTVWRNGQKQKFRIKVAERPK